MELAAYLLGKCKSVTVLSRSQFPFSSSLGDRIGEQIKNVRLFVFFENSTSFSFAQLFVSKGVAFVTMGSANLSFTIQDEQAVGVQYDGGSLAFDVLVLGIGTVPRTQFLSSIARTEQGFIEVGVDMQTSVPDVFAGGDVVVHPNSLFGHGPINIQHWQTAQAHGRLAALSMLNKAPVGAENSAQFVPFFWSGFFGKGLRFAGHVVDGNVSRVLIDGDLEGLKFVAYYYNGDGRVTGVATMGMDPVASAFASALRWNIEVTKEDVE